MSSQLRAIYTAIANMDVLSGGAVVTAYDVSDLPASVPSGALPVRLLMPLSGESAGLNGRPMSVGGFGRGSVINWQIVDLLLHTPAAQNKLDVIVPALVDYQVAYMEAMMRLTMPSVAVTALDVGFSVGVYSYANTEYYGVETRLSIREIVR